jgi:hypothetical protein
MLTLKEYDVTARLSKVHAFYCDATVVDIFVWLSQKPKQTDKHVNISTSRLEII